MTKESLNRANEITNKIKELTESLSLLECRVYRRKRDIKEYEAKRTHWIPIPKWFGRGTIENKRKVNLDIPIECTPRLEFELDEECVNFIINHQKEKIKMLEKELEEL
jgi:hypothetical protein